MPVRVPRYLKLAWAAVGTIVVLGIAWLQYLGPLPPPRPPHVVRGAGIAIPAPSPLLLAASTADAAWRIPHPGPYGVTPMHYYAARSAQAGHAPRVAIMVGGIGYAQAAGFDAVKELPGAVSLALTPYGAHSKAIAAAARLAGHETIMGLPMQTDREPDVTEGDEALRDGSLTADNRKRLDWALSRVAGFAGVTDAIGQAGAETFLTHQADGAWLAGALSHDGLFLVVASKGVVLPTGVAGRAADLTIPADQDAASVATALDRLSAIAKANGSALGVLVAPTGPDIAALADWCKTLKTQGITLVPVSALAAPEPALP